MLRSNFEKKPHELSYRYLRYIKLSYIIEYYKKLLIVFSWNANFKNLFKVVFSRKLIIFFYGEDDYEIWKLSSKRIMNLEKATLKCGNSLWEKNSRNFDEICILQLKNFGVSEI